MSSSPVDLTPRWANYAAYLPAINSSFARAVNAKGAGGLPAPYKIADLNFLNPRSKLWFYGDALYSAGQFGNAKYVADAVTARDRKRTMILGDSGGFQIGSGTLAGLKKVKAAKTPDAVIEAWRGAYKTRDWIVQWLEHNADVAMTIDLPLWCINAKKSPFRICTPDQLTKLTVENLKFIQNEKQGHCKWLNVLQGFDDATIKTWWDAVKKYRFDGWALGGIMGRLGDVSALMQQVLIMREENALDAGLDWIHVLGVAQTRWAVVLTAVQQNIRRTTNPKLRITYDSASAFQAAGITQNIVLYPRYTNEEASWAFKNARVPLGFAYAAGKAQRNFPFHSPVGDVFDLSMFNVNDDAFSRSHFDALSYVLLQNHNAWIYLRALQEANDIASLEIDNKRELMPKSLIDGLAAIDAVFNAKNWRAALKANTEVLNATV